jgi:hypothetical protein
MRTSVRPRRHKGDQIPTIPVTVAEIMASPTFSLGTADARAGRGYRRDYQTWHTNAQWCYERGRQFAQLVPGSVTLKRDGKLTASALEWGLQVFQHIR